MNGLGGLALLEADHVVFAEREDNNDDEGAQGKEGPTTGSVLPVCACVKEEECCVTRSCVWRIQRRIRMLLLCLALFGVYTLHAWAGWTREEAYGQAPPMRSHECDGVGILQK